MATEDTLLRDVIGGRTATALAKQLDLVTVGDLLRHYPRRYAERGQLTDLARLTVGDEVTVLASVHSVSKRKMQHRRGNILEVVVSDGHSRLALTFFNQVWRAGELVPGRSGLFAGKVSEFRGKRQLTTPEYVLLDGSQDTDAGVQDYAGSLIPVYPASEKLPSWTVARCVRVVLDSLDPVPDPIPSALRARRHLVDLDTALRGVHRPDGWPELRRAQQRLKWDEALGVQLTLAQRRHAAAVNPAIPRPWRAGGLADIFDARLPFTLTAGQRAVGETLAAELAGEHPMQRLLQGEVGSGKTVVALRAMLRAVDAGGQAALLAPTEVLAAQHLRTIESMLGELAQGGRLGGTDDATRVTLLTGSQPAAARRQALLDAASGAAGIVVGTHALLGEGVQFADLALVVVDEQHRFGVEQRDVLRYKSAAPPHLLVMTATPIPRTVAMTVFGDLETSVLSELPAGRAPIASSVVPAGEKPAWLERAWQRIAEEVGAGRQAYVVCPRIGEDGDAGAATDEDLGGDTANPTHAVLATAADLADGPLRDLRVGVLHGRLPGEEKDRVMRRFAEGGTDVLVSTTVIEVGVDVPNATVMAVLDADRFGVSQLHQLRGRVGRGAQPGLCLLVTEAPAGSPTRERLEAVAATTDGFELARLDLEQRREGDVLGVAQAGRRSSLKLLSLLRDEDLITAAREEAAIIVAADAELEMHPLLARRVGELVDDERSRFLDKA